MLKRICIISSLVISGSLFILTSLESVIHLANDETCSAIVCALLAIIPMTLYISSLVVFKKQYVVTKNE